jgi:hypothetical protein
MALDGEFDPPPSPQWSLFPRDLDRLLLEPLSLLHDLFTPVGKAARDERR